MDIEKIKSKIDPVKSVTEYIDPEKLFNCNISQLINKLQEIEKRIPNGYFDYQSYEDDYPEFSIRGIIPKTEAEIQAELDLRISVIKRDKEIADKNRAEKEAKDLKEYIRLKKKYDPKSPS